MSRLETVELSAGELITASFGELRESRREVLIYLGVFLLANVVASVAPAPVSGLLQSGGWLGLIGYFFGQYLLYRTMLRRAGHFGADGRIRIFGFVGMAAVIGLCVMFSMSLFVIPAIIVGARWITAPCYIVATDRGVFQSLGESWSSTSGNTLPLSLAFTALVLIFFVLLTVSGAIAQVFEGVLGTKLVSGFVGHFLPLLLMGLSVAAYRRLNDDGLELAAVFA